LVKATMQGLNMVSGRGDGGGEIGKKACAVMVIKVPVMMDEV
jgi:hypothetical protein